MKKTQVKKIKGIKKINRVKLSASEILKKNPVELPSDVLYFDSLSAADKKLFPNKKYTRNGTKKIRLTYLKNNNKLNGTKLSSLGFSFKRGGSTNSFIKKIGYHLENLKFNENKSRIIDGTFKKS